MPKNMTPHLLQPLDLTTNTSLKKIEKKTFSKYLSSSIIEALKEDPTRGDTTMKVNLRISVFRPLHANVTKETYQFFESLKGKEVILNGWSSRDNGSKRRIKIDQNKSILLEKNKWCCWLILCDQILCPKSVSYYYTNKMIKGLDPR